MHKVGLLSVSCHSLRDLLRARMISCMPRVEPRVDLGWHVLEYPLILILPSSKDCHLRMQETKDMHQGSNADIL